MRRITILLDTNMLMLLAEGVNVFEQIEEKLCTKPDYVVLKPVYMELVKLAESGKPSICRKARMALEIIPRYCRIVDYENGSVDELLIKYALENNAAVATNDRELRRKLRERSIPEIYLREESMRIEIEGVEL